MKILTGIIALACSIPTFGQQPDDSIHSKTDSLPTMYKLTTLAKTAKASIEAWTWEHDASKTLIEFSFVAHGVGYLEDETSDLHLWFGKDDDELYRRFCKAMKWVIKNPGKEPIQFASSNTKFSESQVWAVSGIQRKKGQFAAISTYNDKGDIVIAVFTSKEIIDLFERY